MCDLTHKPLEWKLADEQLCRFLVLSNLPEGHSARSIAMWFLDSLWLMGLDLELI